jgi:hypothetical protein
MWNLKKSNIPFPVSTDFLYKFFKAMPEDYEVAVRRELGEVFSQVLKSESNILIEGISVVLPDSSCIHSGIMRLAIMSIYR